jgi:wyosine [tRNA(Phe)-imidazoG37] synthetase (radical SAM superfamily)
MRVAMDPEGLAVTEPRIRYIAREIQRLLALVEFEQNGEPVKVNGFRLRNLGRWTGYSVHTAMNALTPISSVCNSKCQFCFEENVPFTRDHSLMSLAEARTRLKYYSPDTGTSLFPSSRFHMEPFIHPDVLEIVELARRREPGKLFWMTSNGSHFTEDVVRRLAALKPIIFKLSLNASDPAVNQALMKTGRRTAIAIESPRLLQKYRIPFMGGIVAWPTMTLENIRETVAYLEQFEPYAIRIRLPLAHQWLAHQLEVDFHEHWRKVSEFARDLRPNISVPLFVEPPIYWMNAIVPEIDGVVAHSPAHRAGLRAGDIVRQLNGRPVHTRIESEAILDRCHIRRDQTVDITVERAGRTITTRLTELDDDTDTYPYNSEVFYRGENYGIFHVEDFRLKYVQQVIEAIHRHEARTVLLFSSIVVAPIARVIIDSLPEYKAQLEGIDLRFETIDENTFGGNYDLLDGRMVADFARVIRRRIAETVRPDLILIPDAFGGPWGLDFHGRSVEELAMEFDIPVERIEWLLVYGREV